MSTEADFHIQYQHDNDDQEEDCSHCSHYIEPDYGRITGRSVCDSRNICGREREGGKVRCGDRG